MNVLEKLTQRVKKLTLFFAPLLIYLNSYAQPTGVDSYTSVFLTVTDGVPYDNVDGLVQDDKGFMWISTFGGGVARYDGSSFLTFSTKSEPALKSNLVTESCTDRFGRLWVAGVEGIDVLDLRTLSAFDATDKVYETSDGLFCNFITSDAHGSIWYNTLNELYKVSFASDGSVSRVDSLRCSDTDFNLRLNFRDVDEDGSVWTSLGGYIYKVRYVEGTGLTRMKLYPDELFIGEENKVSDFLRVDNTVWIGTVNGLYRLDLISGDVKVYLHSEGVPGSISHNQVTGLAQTSDGKIVVGTLAGVNIYNSVIDGFISYSAQMNKFGDCILSDNQVRSLLTVGNQIWVGTELNGISVLKQKRLPATNVTHRENDMNSIPPSPISAIHFDSKGRLWLGSVEHGLLLETSDYQFKCFTINNSGLFHNSVNAIEEDPVRGKLWIGTMGERLNMVDINDPYTVLPVPASGSTLARKIDNVNDLAYDAVNDYMWLCSRSGLYWYDLENSTFHKFGDSMSLCFSSCIDSRGTLWVGHRGGLTAIDLKTMAVREYDDLGFCFAVTVDSFGNLWVGTFDNGVMKTSVSTPGEFRHYTVAEGLADDRVKGLVAEGDYLWVTTERGLSRINLATDQVESFTGSDGLHSISFYDHAVTLGPEGAIYLGHKGGYSILWSNYVLPSSGNASRLSFTRGYLDDETVNLAYEGSLRVKERQRYISFEFADLSFETEGQIVYSTRIYPMDKDWRVLNGDSRTVRYASIPGGKYKLQIRATDISGKVISEDERDLVVKPLAYKTWWFALLMLMAAAVSATVFYKYRTRNLRRMRAVLQQEVDRQTTLLSQQKRELEERAETLAEQNKLLLKQNEEMAGRTIVFSTGSASGHVSKDTMFVEAVMAKIRNLYKDPGLDVNALSASMGMSRSVLNGKLQDSFGQSTGQFIRTYRLNVAREIICSGKVGGMNVSEIAYEVGFNDPKYFTRCFSKAFGMSPSQMMNGDYILPMTTAGVAPEESGDE